MRKITFIIATLVSCFAHGQLANLPDPAGLLRVGRLTVFKSVQPLSWMMPTAFSTEMECTNNLSGDKRTCTVKIFNKINSQEENKISNLMQVDKLGVTAFTNVDSQVVQNIQETFEGIPQDIQANSMSLKTLALSDGLFPYGSMMFRVTKDRASELLESYENEGLGTFTVRFMMNVQNTEMYLAVRDGACLKNSLKTSVGKAWTKSQVKGLIDQTLSLCQLSKVAYDDKEAKEYLAYHLRDVFYSYKKGYFTLNEDELNRVGERYTLQNDLGDVTPVSCEMKLSLAKGAQPETVCQYQNGEVL